jgi:hypothetical protein
VGLDVASITAAALDLARAVGLEIQHGPSSKGRAGVA